MSLINRKKKEDVRKIILALLMSQKGAMPLTQLDREYAEQEGDRIPWKEFGHTSLLDFLRTMPECLRIEMRDRSYYVQGVPSDKSKHVNSLVTRQRSPRTRRKTMDRRKFQSGTSGMYWPHCRIPRQCVPADTMASIMRCVRQSGKEGVSKDCVLQKINEKLPHSNFTDKNLEDHIKNIPHELYMKNNVLYAIKKENPLTKDVENETVNCSNFRYCVSGEDSVGNEDSPFVFHSRDATTLAQCKTTKKPTSSVIEDTASDYMTSKSFHEVQSDLLRGCPNGDSEDYFYFTDDEAYLRRTNQDIDISIRQEASELICERTRLRLERLIEKYPDGIWCFELPNAYQEEYKVPLNYAELGFDSVLDFASHLPEIFTYVEVPNPMGDFKLYSAKNTPLPNKDREIVQKDNLSPVYDEIQCVRDAIPPVVAPRWSDQLIPNHVMTLGESVGHVYVMNLLYTESPLLEVLVVEVFNPSFFWVHLRKNSEHFDDLMANINNFYNAQSEDYLMPAIVLKVGMNCACVYQNTWHRGIIKSVQSDSNDVVVMFYDYGTLKAYTPNAIYFLHRQFSNLPAQALPCGLFNVKPREGDQWPRSVTHRFAVRSDKIPLAATIKSIDESDNSMMITLTDTLGEEDVNLNDWLVQENMAAYGKMVGIRTQNFAFQYHRQCQKPLDKDSNVSDELETSFEMGGTSHSKKQGKMNLALWNLYMNMKRMRSTIGSLSPRNDDNGTSDNSDVASCGAGDSTDKICQMDEKLISSKSTSRKCTSDGEESYNSSVVSGDALKEEETLGINKANISERYKATIDLCSRRDNDKILRKDSDIVMDELEYFGTFQSLCGGHGRMEPIDWSAAVNSSRRSSILWEKPQREVDQASERFSHQQPVRNDLNSNNAQDVYYDEEQQVKSVLNESDAEKLNRAFFRFVQGTDHCLLYNENTCFPLESNILKTEHAPQSVAQRKKLLNISNIPRQRIVIPKNVYGILRECTTPVSDSSNHNDGEEHANEPQKSTLTTSDALLWIREQYGSSDSDTEEVITNEKDNGRLLVCDKKLNGQVEEPTVFARTTSMTVNSKSKEESREFAGGMKTRQEMMYNVLSQKYSVSDCQNDKNDVNLSVQSSASSVDDQMIGQHQEEEGTSDESNLQRTAVNNKGTVGGGGEEEKEEREEQQHLRTSGTLIPNDRQSSAAHELYDNLPEKRKVCYSGLMRKVRALGVKNLLSRTEGIEFNTNDVKQEACDMLKLPSTKGSTSDLIVNNHQNSCLYKNDSLQSPTFDESAGEATETTEVHVKDKVLRCSIRQPKESAKTPVDVKNSSIKNNVIHEGFADVEAVKQTAANVSLESNREEVEIGASNISTITALDLLHLKSKDIPAYNDEDVESNESEWDAYAEVGEIIGGMLSGGSVNPRISNTETKISEVFDSDEELSVKRTHTMHNADIDDAVETYEERYAGNVKKGTLSGMNEDPKSAASELKNEPEAESSASLLSKDHPINKRDVMLNMLKKIKHTYSNIQGNC